MSPTDLASGAFKVIAAFNVGNMKKSSNTKSFVAVIGAANVDLTGVMIGESVEGDSNPGEVTVSSGGVARNIAENIVRLGTRCELITAMGNDAWSKQLTEHCSSVGIGLIHSIVSPEHRTSSYLSVHDSQGELITAINDMSILSCINTGALAERLDILRDAACWVVDANLSADALLYLFDVAGNIPIWIDPVSSIKAKRLIPHLSKIHCLTPNLQEAAVLTGMPTASHNDAPVLANKLHQLGVKQVMITLGEQGAYASDALGAFWLSAQQTQVVNVTGCGDAAIAALVHGSINDINWRDSGELAMAAAAVTANSTQTNSPLISTLGIKT